jgi:hypothetical protein
MMLETHSKVSKKNFSRKTVPKSMNNVEGATYVHICTSISKNIGVLLI